MKLHANARLTVHGRLLLVQRVLGQGERVAQAASCAGVSECTAYRWLHRYREEGSEGLRDRSSRPHRSPGRTQPRKVERILRLRRRGLVAWEIAPQVGVPRSTVSRLLLQHGRRDEGAKLVAKSQEIRARSGLDEAVGSEYGEQGRLSRAADYPGGSLEAPQAIAVRFETGSQIEAAAGRVAGTVVPTTDGVALLVARGRSLLQLGAAEPVATLDLDCAEIVALAAGDTDNDSTVDVALLAVVGTTGEDEALVPLWLRQSEAGWQPAGGWSGSAETVVDGEMPPGYYSLVTHRDARLSDEERRELIDGLEATAGLHEEDKAGD